MKVIIGGTFPPGATEMFVNTLPASCDTEVIENSAELAKRSDVEVLITRGFEVDEKFLAQNPKLKMIQKWGTGVNTIDLGAATRHKVPVCNVPGANAYAVAELTVMLMLAVYRNLLYHNAKLKAGIWSKADRVEQTYCLRGKTIGIIGGGNIGRLVAGLTQAFGARTVYYDAFRLPDDVEKEHRMEFVPLDELLKISDIVTLHIPLTDSTKNFISKKQLDLMKPTAVLINAARGGLVCEPDLLAALDSGRLMGAGVDCLCGEKDKLRADDPMLHNDKITAMPHVGGTSNDLASVMVPRIVANVGRLLKGEPLVSVVNKEVL